jgi:hypothetical protein
MAYALKRLSERKTYRDGIRLSGEFGICYGTLEDLSARGLRAKLDQSIDSDQIVDAQFAVYVPGQGRVSFQLKAKIIRTENAGSDYELGLKFVDLPARESRMLSILLESAAEDAMDRF